MCTSLLFKTERLKPFYFPISLLPDEDGDMGQVVGGGAGGGHHDASLLSGHVRPLNIFRLRFLVSTRQNNIGFVVIS